MYNNDNSCSMNLSHYLESGSRWGPHKWVQFNNDRLDVLETTSASESVNALINRYCNRKQSHINNVRGLSSAFKRFEVLYVGKVTEIWTKKNFIVF